MDFTLAVINPNSDDAVTSYLRQATARVLPAGSNVEAGGCPDSPPVLETALDEVMAAPAVITRALAMSEPDAFVVGCFSGPAVPALRELSAKPVIGLGEAALTEASLVTSRFGVLTTLERGIPGIWEQLGAAGMAGRCAGIRPAQAAPESPGGDGTFSRLARQGSALLAAGADGLVLACAAFGPHRQRLAGELDVPVCDGIAAAASLAYGLFASGIRTSKQGGYGWPVTGPAESLQGPAS